MDTAKEVQDISLPSPKIVSSESVIKSSESIAEEDGRLKCKESIIAGKVGELTVDSSDSFQVEDVLELEKVESGGRVESKGASFESIGQSEEPVKSNQPEGQLKALKALYILQNHFPISTDKRKELVGYLSDPDIVNTRFGHFDSNTLLHVAASRADLESVELLIFSGAKVNSCNNCGDLPIHLTRDYKTTEALVGAGSLINATGHRGDTPLHNAILFKKYETIQLLLSEGASVKIPRKSIHAFNRPTPIDLVKGYKDTKLEDIFKIFLDKSSTKNGCTSTTSNSSPESR